MVVLVTNSLGWHHNATVSVQLPEDLRSVGVTDEEGVAVLSHISTPPGRATLHFHGLLPALGVKAFFVRNLPLGAVSLAGPSEPARHTPSGPARAGLTLSLVGGRVRAIFSDLTGALLALEDV